MSYVPRAWISTNSPTAIITQIEKEFADAGFTLDDTGRRGTVLVAQGASQVACDYREVAVQGRGSAWRAIVATYAVAFRAETGWLFSDMATVGQMIAGGARMGPDPWSR